MDIIREELEPKRMQYAIQQITELGYIVKRVSDSELEFEHKGHVIKMFPYTGWHSGKSIKDGRGIHNLTKQLIN